MKYYINFIGDLPSQYNLMNDLYSPFYDSEIGKIRSLGYCGTSTHNAYRFYTSEPDILPSSAALAKNLFSP